MSDEASIRFLDRSPGSPDPLGDNRFGDIVDLEPDQRRQLGRSLLDDIADGLVEADDEMRRMALQLRQQAAIS